MVLVLPFAIRQVEHNLELFFFAMGVAAVSVTGAWSTRLVFDALYHPIPITSAVLGVGLVFHFGRRAGDRYFRAAQARMPASLLYFLIVVLLGLASSLITAIIAALILSEIIHLLRIGRRQEVRLAVIACFAIGLGAALTPLGEPLSTIVIVKLKADFWYLARLIGLYIIPGVAALGLLAARIKPEHGSSLPSDSFRHDPLPAVFTRAAKVFAFVAALLLLGEGLTPLVDRYLVKLSAPLLFWVNTISAVLDNATLAAAEVSRSLSGEQLVAILLGLLVSGGMLIPGNIPNIICANHLRIRSREWAAVGVPLGAVLLVVYFATWFFIGRYFP